MALACYCYFQVVVVVVIIIIILCLWNMKVSYSYDDEVEDISVDESGGISATLVVEITDIYLDRSVNIQT
jgi:surface polysaccharide O-acyltransferase-like enzyme